MRPILTYIAGKWTAQERLRKEAEFLLSLGKFGIVSTWLWVKEEEENRPKWREYAIKDEGQVLSANLFILDTIDESNTGGREVELGMAMAKNKITVLIGPKRNIFHELIEHQFDCWDEFYYAVNGLAFTNTAIALRLSLDSCAKRS